MVLRFVLFLVLFSLLFPVHRVRDAETTGSGQTQRLSTRTNSFWNLFLFVFVFGLVWFHRTIWFPVFSFLLEIRFSFRSIAEHLFEQDSLRPSTQVMESLSTNDITALLAHRTGKGWVRLASAIASSAMKLRAKTWPHT